jgi:SOS-response transcriptional repressor LexA
MWWRQLHWVRVAGPSMTPTLRNGDLLLVRRTTRAAPGDVVLAKFVSLPDRYVVKRTSHEVDGQWWLDSDNPYVEGDSASHGLATVLGRALIRFPAGSFIPRRVR